MKFLSICFVLKKMSLKVTLDLPSLDGKEKTFLPLDKHKI